MAAPPVEDEWVDWLMSYDELVGFPVFRLVMIVASLLLMLAAGAAFWVALSSWAGWRESIDVRGVADGRYGGDVHELAAAVRMIPSMSLGLLSTAVHGFLLGYLGPDYRFEEWRYWIYSLVIVFIWILASRQLGWPNILVAREVRTIPGLLPARLAERKRARGIAEPDRVDKSEADGSG
jgi:hypothetical protein